ncbi:hypothetical protein L3X38_027251 [Prunus dulcis]|uniref:Uncharacterized protein n=1 Tax=Prunus dulcis TaxID=3755 RepID=A0AAD4VMH1_PRUDU|nr:hypothetical protein L3X38_027251 [Prunus dulcis]
MGRKGHTTVAAELTSMTEAEIDVQHDKFEAQLQEFQNTVTTISRRQDEVQTNISEMLKTLATISENQGQNASFQRMVMEEFQWEVAGDAEPATEITDVTTADEPPHTDDFLINLHAIATKKRTRGRAMKLKGTIEGISILVFIDSGVDYNFLNPKFLEWSGWKPLDGLGGT